MIAGLLPPDAGSIAIFGIDALADPVAAKRITAWLPDEPMLYDKLTPLEYLEFVAGLWGVERERAERNAAELLEVLELTPHAHARCEGFSRGMKQKVALAGALIHDPRLIMLDEPLTGLDAAIARQVKDLLTARVRAGATIILTTHILEVAERLADRIGIVDHGRLIAEGTLAELKSTLGRGGSATLEDVFLAVTGKDARVGMRLQAGSLPWLIAHDLTLNWRRFMEMFARLSPRRDLGGAGRRRDRPASGGVAGRRVARRGCCGTAAPPAPRRSRSLMFSVLAWMIAQGLLGTSRTLQERGSGDLLLSSPLPVRLVLASRAAATAASSFGSVGLLVLPVADMGRLLDGPAWLAAYPALLALALIGTAAGLAAAIGLFLVLDPRRARAYRAAVRGAGGRRVPARRCRSSPCCPTACARRSRTASPARKPRRCSTWPLLGWLSLVAVLGVCRRRRCCSSGSFLRASLRAAGGTARQRCPAGGAPAFLAVRVRARARRCAARNGACCGATTACSRSSRCRSSTRCRSPWCSCAASTTFPLALALARPSSSSPRRSPPRWPGSPCRARTRRS